MKENKVAILRLVLKQAALASGVLFIISAAALAFIYFSGTPGNIKDSPALLLLKEKIEKEPVNTELIKTFREKDLKERTSYFDKSNLLDSGIKICIVFLILFLTAQRALSLLNRKIPEVKKGSDLLYTGAKGKEGQLFFISTSITGAFILILLLIASISGTGKYPWQSEKNDSGLPSGSNEAKEDLSKEWCAFRGNDGRGVALPGAYPVFWDVKNNKNILWKAALPVKGYSSPIVYKNKVVITGSEKKKLKVLCYDALTGEQNWSSPVLITEKHDDIEVMTEDDGGAGYSAPTPVTDGTHIYAYFATNRLVCFDMDGKQKWLKDFGKPENTYGLSASPVLFEDKVIVQADQSGEGLSRLYAVNKNTGKIAWEVKRPDGASWGTPLLIEYKGRKELITTAKPWVISYAPASGKELWKVECLSGEVSTSPSFSDGKVYVMSVDSQTKTFALLPGGNGDVTGKNIVWKKEEESQAINTPAALNTKIIIAMNGYVAMRDSTEGKIIWQYKAEDDFWASPVIAGENIYIPSQGGKVFVVTLEGKPVRIIDMGEKLSATPAFKDSCIYIRSNKYLYCIKEEKK